MPSRADGYHSGGGGGFLSVLACGKQPSGKTKKVFFWVVCVKCRLSRSQCPKTMPTGLFLDWGGRGCPRSNGLCTKNGPKVFPIAKFNNSPEECLDGPRAGVVGGCNAQLPVTNINMLLFMSSTLAPIIHGVATGTRTGLS